MRKPGRGDADLADGGVGGHPLAQRLGHVERAHAGEALDAEREIGGVVAVLGPLGMLEGDGGSGERGQRRRRLRLGERPFDQPAQLVANHAPSLSRRPRRVRAGEAQAGA